MDHFSMFTVFFFTKLPNLMHLFKIVFYIQTKKDANVLKDGSSRNFFFQKKEMSSANNLLTEVKN